MKLLRVCGAAIWIVTQASGATLKVPSGNFPNIQSAVNAAAPGDVIEIARKVYHGRVLIKNKTDLTLVALRGAVVDRRKAGTALSIIDCDGIEVRRLAVRNTGGDDGILVKGSINVTLQGLKVSNVGDHGMRFRRVFNSSILNCRVSGTEHDGIHVDGDEIFISGNTITGALGDGIGVSGSQNTVEGNLLKGIGDDGCQIGDGVATTEFNLVVDNRLRKIGRGVGSNGLKVFVAPGTSLVDNSCVGIGDKGVSIFDSDFCIVDGNRIRNSGGNGIHLEISSGINLTSNSIRKPRKQGIFLGVRSDDTLLIGVTIRRAGTTGLQIRSDGNIVIESSGTKSGKFDLKDMTQSTVFIDSNFPKTGP